MTFSDIRQLLRILTEAVDTLEADFKQKGLDFPSLDAPFSEGSPAELATGSEDAIKAANLIVGATAQLAATVRVPFANIMEYAQISFIPASLQFVVTTHVSELLRDAGAQGMHVRDIAAKAAVDETKLAHVLRYLATYHVFREIAPDVFAHNRISSLLDTGKPFDKITDDPRTVFPGSNGVAAFVLMSADMIALSAKLAEHYTGPDKFSHAPDNTVLTTALGIKGQTMFSWLEKPENAKIAMTYGFAMGTSKYMEVPGGITEGYDWASLKDGSVIVDVGGGIGNAVVPLYKTYPTFKFEIQDRAQSIGHAKMFWPTQSPDALTSRRVSLRVHSFLEPQPVKDAAVFLLRNVLHNWPDAFIVRILKHLRDAAAAETTLLLVDRILPYACPAGAVADTSGIPGAEPWPAPAPLLNNLGRASGTVHALDVGVAAGMNGGERTIAELVALMTQARWKINRVNRVRGDICVAHVVAVPAE